jgi:hypothetical protein
MADLGKTSSGNEADVARPDERQLHGCFKGTAGVGAGAGNLLLNSIERIAASEPSEELRLALATSWYRASASLSWPLDSSIRAIPNFASLAIGVPEELLMTF